MAPIGSANIHLLIQMQHKEKKGKQKLSLWWEPRGCTCNFPTHHTGWQGHHELHPWYSFILSSSISGHLPLIPSLPSASGDHMYDLFFYELLFFNNPHMRPYRCLSFLNPFKGDAPDSKTALGCAPHRPRHVQTDDRGVMNRPVTLTNPVE